MNGAIVTIDSREPAHIQGQQWSGALTMTASLEFGDVQIQMPNGDLILVERKTPRDFLSSIKDRRLFNQVAGMVEKTRWAYVLVEGGFLENDRSVFYWWNTHSELEKTKWGWHSIQGALLSIQELGCAIIYDCDFRGAIERIANRSRSDVKIAPRREPYVFSLAEQILMALPGIGNKKAQEFLEIHNGNVALALTTMTAPHDGKKNYLPGWGKKSRDNLVELLGGRLEYKLNE